MTAPLSKLCSFVLIAGLSLSGLPSQAQEDAAPPTMAAVEQAWQRGDFAEARKGLEHLANTLDTPLAQYRYGRILLEGRGGPQNVAEGVEWLEKAVAQNHPEAATLLARALLSQPKETRDPKRAASLFLNAAARGNAEAQYYLGLLYRRGQGVEADAVASFNWLLASSEGFNKDAQYELSRAYAQGVGTAQNNKEALRWMEEAAANGQRDAQYSLALSYEVGAGVNQSDSQAVQWFTKAAEAGHILAQRSLGTAYLQGINGKAPDAEKALRWLTAAADAGEPGAMNNLALAYFQGTVIPNDDALALHYFEEASYRRLARATMALAGMTEAGRGTEANIKKAVELYELAATQGDPAGLKRVSQLALAGRMDDAYAPHDLVKWIAPLLQEPDNETAVNWMQAQVDARVRSAQAALGSWYLTQEGKTDDGFALIESAAIAGHVAAQHQLGAALATGDGIELDYVNAYAWLNVAAAGGHEESIETRDLIVDLMTPDQVSEAQKIARAFFEEAANRAPNTEQTVTGVSE
ncbi:hypothetical protein [Planktotalea sp.]|uniref:SEL1-like repeat protein n=1 Tax=Planktotalea sp. TaxID=2029877 RepID=UPI0032976A41